MSGRRQRQPPRRRAADRTQDRLDKQLTGAPWFLRLFLDVIMFRSTPLTAVVWGTILIAGLAHVAYSCNYFERWGIRGFQTIDAAEAAQQKLGGSVDSMKGEISWNLHSQIRLMTVIVCHAPKETIERAQLAAALDQMTTQYAHLTQQTIVPTCNDALP